MAKSIIIGFYILPCPILCRQFAIFLVFFRNIIARIIQNHIRGNIFSLKISTSNHIYHHGIFNQIIVFVRRMSYENSDCAHFFNC